VALTVISAAWWITREGLLVLLLLGAGWQLFRPAAEEPDPGTLASYVALVWALAVLTVVPVPTPGR
jgi:hypothetical protein